MSSATTNPYNYSLQSVPAAFVLGIAPHGYILGRLMIATSGKLSNAMYVNATPNTSIHPLWQCVILLVGHAPTSKRGEVPSQANSGTT